MQYPSAGFRLKLASCASVIAIAAYSTSFAHSDDPGSYCHGALHVVPGTITGTYPCAVARNVVGDVVNDGTIGPPAHQKPGIFVGTGGIIGSLLNEGTIQGGGFHGGEGGEGDDEEYDHFGYGSRILGALTIATDISGGVDNTGTISSVYGNGIQLGYGGGYYEWAHRALMTGSITNSGLISSDSHDAIAALFGSMSGGLLNKDGGDIEGNRGVYIASTFEIWTGGIENHGSVRGASSAIQIGDEYFYGKHDVEFAGGIINGEGGELVSETGPTIIVNGASFSGGITNAGLITQELPGLLVLEEGSRGIGIEIAAETFSGGITNSGHIYGFEGPAVWIRDSVSEFMGGFENSGTIKSVVDGVLIEASSFQDGFQNDGGLIRGGDGHAGVSIEVDDFAGGFTNSGTITGGLTGVYMSGDSFEGSIVNSGTISGGVTSDGEAALNDPAHVVSFATMTGDIVNTGTWDAANDALVLTIGHLDGAVTNKGLIEATDSGATAVRLDIGNGTTFSNIEGGHIVGDVLFGGKNAGYGFVGADGGVEGNLIGVSNFDSEANDDSIIVQGGTQYFVVHDGSGAGSASSFADFTVESGGTAILGATSFGSSGGNGYNLVNVDHLNVNVGGNLYVDNQSTLNVGSFTQAAGSTLSFYISEPAGQTGTQGVNFGQVNATGTVTLGGTLQAVINPLSFSGTGQTQYDFQNAIVAGSPITTDFVSEQIFGGSAFYQLEHSIHDNAVDLHLVRIAFTAPSCSENGDRLGQLLETLFQGGSLTPEEQALFSFLSQLPADQVCGAFDQIGGTKQADLGSVVVETAGPWKSLVNDRVNGLGAVGCNLAGEGGCLNRFAANDTQATQVMTDATPGTDPFDWLKTGTRRVGDTAAWGRMVGVWGGTDAVAGVGGMDFALTGGLVGMDHVFTEDILAGVAVQYTTDDLSFKNSTDDANVDSFEVGAYASFGDTRFYLNTNASFIWHDFQVQRALSAGGAFAKYSGTTVSAYAEMGRIFEADDLRIQPILALSVAHLQTDGYRENGAALGLLAVQDAEFTTVKSMIGSRLAMPFELESGRKIVPEARAVWAHEFADDQSTFKASLQSDPTSTLFVVKGRQYSRDSIILGTGVTAPLSDEASISLDYDASINPDIVTHTISAGFRLKW
ncbi:MAG: autotransporter domain-containing protein [Micropepsaceae bacterium]